MNNQISIREDLSKVALLRRPDVERVTGLSRSSIYAMMKIGEFPQSIPLTGRIVAWLQSEILEWVQSRIEIRKTNTDHARPQSQPHRIRDAHFRRMPDVQSCSDSNEVSAGVIRDNAHHSDSCNITQTDIAVIASPELIVHSTNVQNAAITDIRQS